jgi:S-adenosylmethionine decarboxylase
MEFLGKHATLDLTNFFLSSKEGGEFILQIMRESVTLSTCREVHHKLVILGDVSSPGFTSVVLIDESHITAHCYSDRGLLAIDVFTCGDSNPILLIDFIFNKIKEKVPDIKCIHKHILDRFPV